MSRDHHPKVLYVVLATEYSGAETAQAPILQADREALLACPPGSNTERWARGLAVETVALPHRTLRHSGGAILTVISLVRGLRSAVDLRSLLVRHPERGIVVGTSLRPSLMASLATIGLRGRRVVWTVTDVPPRGALGVGIRILALLMRPRIVAHSRWVAERLAPGRSRLRTLIAVQPPGVATAAESLSQPDHADGGSRVRALLVGPISVTKRTDLGVETALRVAATVPGFSLQIIGQAQYRPEDFEVERALVGRVRSDPLLRSHVEFVGHEPDVASRMREATLLLHCRPDEPFGMVVLEAMAAGLPVVAPAAGGLLELVEDGETGLLYPPGDADAAAQAVIALLRDESRARRMGMAGRRRAERLFSVQAQVEASKQLMRQLV